MAKTFRVVTLGPEELLEVGLAVVLSFQRSIVSGTDGALAVLALEAGLMEDDVVDRQSVHWVDSLLTGLADFACSLGASGASDSRHYY